MGETMQTSKPQATQPLRLATVEMASLWQAATGALLHGPRCTCVGFGMMHRSRAELERDIAEFLIARYEDRRDEAMVRLFQRWIDERMPAGLLQWIDRKAPAMGLSADGMREIGADIRTLLQSLATPAAGFMCS
jgi:hypothetical protein